MALQHLYTLHDVKALIYNPPFPAANHAVAKRMVTELASDLNTSVGRHPSDYKLYYLGNYDDSNGSFAILSVAEHVSDVVALLPMPVQQQPFNFDKKAAE